MIKISDRIKEKVKEKGVSLNWLSEQIGVSSVGFYRMIDNNSFKVDTLQKIASALEIPIVFFLAEEEDVDMAHVKNVINKKVSGSETYSEKAMGKFLLMALNSASLVNKIMAILQKSDSSESYPKEEIISDLEKCLDEFMQSTRTD